MYRLLGLLVIIFSIFNIITAIKRKSKRLVILNGVLYAVIAFILIWNNVNTSIISNDSVNYNIYHGGILSSVRYDRTEDDYYIIKRTGFMTCDEIAIPVKSANISSFSRLYKPVQIYCSKDTELYGSEIIVNSKRYYLCDTVIKIAPDFFDLILTIGIIDIIAILIFNLVLFIINIVRLYQEKKDRLSS